MKPYEPFKDAFIDCSMRVFLSIRAKDEIITWKEMDLDT